MKGSLELGQFLEQCEAIASRRAQIEHGADVACGVGKRKEKMYDPAIGVRIVPVHSGSKKRSFDESAATRCAGSTPTFPAREMPKKEDALCVAASVAPTGAPDAKHRWMKQWVRREGGWFRRTWVRRR